MELAAYIPHILITLVILVMILFVYANIGPPNKKRKLLAQRRAEAKQALEKASEILTPIHSVYRHSSPKDKAEFWAKAIGSTIVGAVKGNPDNLPLEIKRVINGSVFAAAKEVYKLSQDFHPTTLIERGLYTPNNLCITDQMERAHLADIEKIPLHSNKYTIPTGANRFYIRSQLPAELAKDAELRDKQNLRFGPDGLYATVLVDEISLVPIHRMVTVDDEGKETVTTISMQVTTAVRFVAVKVLSMRSVEKAWEALQQLPASPDNIMNIPFVSHGRVHVIAACPGNLVLVSDLGALLDPAAWMAENIPWQVQDGHYMINAITQAAQRFSAANYNWAFVGTTNKSFSMQLANNETLAVTWFTDDEVNLSLKETT